jgi:Asp/Glu/hydantoin racemase
MSDLLVLVHTVSPLLPVFDRLAAQMLPGALLKHILDEPLLEVVRMRGGLADSDTARLIEHVDLAEAIGAKAVLVTCSTISPLVDRLKDGARLPVFKIDEAMLDAAVHLGPRIGVLATNPTTLGPTSQLLQERAAAANRSIELEAQLIPDALQALLAGDGDTHDRLVGEAIQSISSRVDAIVLAQASMARVLEVLPESARSKPVLSSPHLALERLQPLYS